ncbi:thioredoxin-like 1-2, chloroplastic [Cornus florida]|uniref:thioredoxin-like 1-2, chloroplastic n=1 Tax=Cornus florida TaxID=4283 RepID=UPI0028A1495B|nr:thioredoxin-like 1-2, chloroplastic [Cornus florida]
MSCSLKIGLSVSGSIETTVRSKTVYGFCPSIPCLQSTNSKSRFVGKAMVLSDQKGLRELSFQTPTNFSVHAQSSICVSRAMRWWEKTIKPSNMMEIYSAQELVESLLNAGDRLVIVDFYSPGCGGCKTLHPKICQMAELNPNAIFLQVNYEELKTMCYSLHIHVLPFFRFYRGAEGRVCSFSCTNATIKKFKGALAKHGTDRCSLGPAKGLDESELLNLASAGEISKNLPLPSSSSSTEKKMEDSVLKGVSTSLSKAGNKMELLSLS